MSISAICSLMRNRYSVTLGVIVAVVVVWNIVVSLNDDGLITGFVVTSDGIPVSGATVVLSNKTLLVTVRSDEVHTNADGQFTFTNHRFHHIWLHAVKPGVGESPGIEFRMYFKGQNLTISEPLRIFASNKQGNEI